MPEEENEETNEEEDEDQTPDVSELSEKLKVLEEKLAEKEEALSKLSDKELNFKRFREAEEEKRTEMLKGFTKKERLLVEAIDSLNERIEGSESARLSEATKAALSELAGDDEDLRKQLEVAVKESVAYLGTPKTNAEIAQRYERAYEMLKGSRRRVNPLNAYHPVTGTQNEQPRDKRFTDTVEGQKLIEEKFPQIAALEKKLKK